LLRLQVVGLADDVDEAAALAAELAGSGGDPEVEHTAAGRRVPRLVPAPAAPPVPLRDGGVYLITGGAGGLGRAVADWVLSRADARVVLLGRSAQPPAELDERVAYRSADVTDTDALIAQLASVRAEFGPLNGVVHAAGVLRDGFVPTKSAADLAAVLAPKVTGLRNVDAATADDPLDFFVVFSSIAAHIGSAGQTDYAYANAFAEAYAERRDRMTAVAWPMWADGGMRQSAEAAADIAARTGFGVLPTTTGLRLLEQALGASGTVVAAYGDTGRIAAALHAPLTTAPAAATGRPAATDGADPHAAALGLLRELIAAETGLDASELAEDAPFDRYGIDSLMITKLNRELDRRFTGLSKTLFFEYATLGELAAYFAERHTAELGGDRREEAAPPAAAGSATPRRARTGRPARAAGPEDRAVAIIGLAGRYPMADDVEEFWANLVAGRDCVEEIPEDRWDSTRWFDPDPAAPGRAHTRWGGFLRHVDRFDPLFFGISPRQAELMDPQERLFLQNAWHVLEDAGYRRADLSGRPVGVYVGVMYGEYQFHGALDALRGGRPLTGSSFATIANRVSHALDLSGPSLALDTMCSSSLTAIHLACESLRRGESELAIAGGVNVSLHPYKYAFLSQGRFLSSDGRCRAFGAGGDGYVPGEGVGAVLLKPYRQALADGDRIHGVILGSAVNHGARTNGYTVPSPHAQQRAITSAMEQAGVAPEDIGYVEAHGTGTALGDPIELTGLTNAYRSAAAEPGRWPIGSVKSNVGHLESAAGVAGLTKVLLQFAHRTLVPSLHAGELNPNIDFDRSPFRVQRELAEWPDEDRPRRAGLSSFGAGGSNAHLVLEEPPRPEPRATVPASEQRTDEPVVFLLSARDEERLRVYAGRAARFLRTERVPLADVCFTTQVGRESLDARLAVVATEGADVVAALERFAEGGPLPEVPADGAPGERARRWLAGAEVDWAAWHASRPGPAPRRTRAPRYPFADERYWIPLDPELTSAPHPLVDANESTVAELRFRKTLRLRDPLVRDHVIEGRPMFAGAATLEFVRAAADLAEPGVRHALRDVLWGRAIEPADAELALYVAFRPGGDGLAFEVYSEAAGGRVTHARGNAVGTPGPHGDALDLAGVRERLAVVRDRTAAYADYRAAGFVYGSSFQVVDEIRSASEEAVLRLSGSPAEEGMALPPGLLDGALRACHWVGRDTAPRPGELPVPFSLGALDVFAPLPPVVYAHARLVGESAGVRRFDVTIHDERGGLLVSLRDFAGRLPGAPAGDREQGQGQARFYEPYWRPAADPEPAAEAPRTLALLGDAPDLEVALAATGGWRRVIRLPGDPDGLTHLLAGAAQEDGLDIAFVQGLRRPPAYAPEDGVDASPTDVLDRSCFLVLDVLRAVASGELPGRVRCLLVHPQDGDEERPESAALAGFARSTTALARFEPLTLGVPAQAPATELAAAMAVELRAAPRAAGLEVRRTAAGDRELRALRPVSASGPSEPPLRERGVYVVTGGAGAIGRVLTGHLARTHRARLVLVGRSEPDQHLLRELAGYGAEVLALRADVTRAGELAAALTTARERFGALHGVFHLAGAADDGHATDDDFGHERFARVLAAKTRGLVHLDRLTRDDALDLFVAFSSISSLIGDFGAASYATANRFADLYMVLRDSWVRRGARHGRSLSLGWPLWSAGGVDSLVGRPELAAYSRRSGMPALEPVEGLAVFERSFAVPAPWLVPAWGDPARIDAALAGPSVPPAQPAGTEVRATAVPTARAAVDGRRARLVEHLRGILAGVLKLPVGRLDSRVALDDYGLDSVLVMESNTVLGRDFPGLRGTVFFEYRTVDELADHLLAEHADAVARLFPEPGEAQRTATPAAQASVSAAPAAATPVPAAPAARAPVAAAPVSAAPAPARPASTPAGAADEPIAVIGVSGRYPQARDLDEFWRNLAAGRDCVTEIPAERWDAEALFDPDPTAAGRSYSRWGGFLSDVDAFDSLFFQISPMQARSMDPQERLFLETAWSALENAGYPPSRLPAPRFGGQGRDVGVFVGVMWDDYAVLAATESARGNHQVVLANRSSIANQVSYFGDFRGPSVVVDTACSASLVAVHQACESIRRGECRYAVAGGVNVAVHPDKYVHLSRKTMLSADGRCRAFGAGGSGYVPGEGVGAVVLKRLSEAVRDGDTVHAVIRATAVNHGGRTSGFTVPNPHAQQALVEQALAAAGISARTIGCVEAHGTGTALGDPIEHTALAQAFARHTADTGFCALGSVKSAIGHLEGAAGIAGLTKAVLQLRHATLLPTLHADEPNPAIDFTRSPFTIQRETAPWPQPYDPDGRPLPRRAAVSSFGAGGTNAHVILEEYVAPEPVAAEPEAPPVPELVVLSARDEKRLRHYAGEVGRALDTPADPPLRLADVAHTLRVGREPMAERLAFVATDIAEAASRLAAVARGEDGQWLHRGRVTAHPPLAGLFSDSVGGEDFLTAQIRSGNDDLLGRLWVSGVAVDWDLMDRGRPGVRRRVPLPTYPFERARHWLDLGSAPVAPGDARAPWRSTLAATAPVLRDHVVDGRAILPGVGHLDLVAEARGEQAAPSFADVRWIAPLVAAGAGAGVSVRFDRDRYEVLGDDGTVRSCGRLTDAPPAPPAVDVPALRARLDEGPGHAAFYRLLEDQGLPYGPFFRRVQQVWTGEAEALGRLGPATEDTAHRLHPGVLDAALHTVAALLVRRRGPGARPLLPFAADRVEVFGPVPASGWSHIRETGTDRCDVLLLDDTGAVRVRFTSLVYREAKPALPAAVAAYRPAWTPSPAEDTAEPAHRVLLIAARPDAEPALSVARAHPDAEVRPLTIGQGGLTDAELDRALGTAAPDLLYFIGAAAEPEPADRAGVRAVMDRGVVSFYRLVRALDRNGLLDRPLRLKVVTADAYPLAADDASAPWQAGLTGAAMVVAKEFPNLRVALLDVRLSEAADAAAAVAREPFPAHTVPVSLRAGVRRVRTLERVELPQAPSVFRPGGVYLVVGGLGAVGRDTCRHLAETHRAKLVVVGRSPLDGPRREQIAELEAAGAEVRYLSLDATDPAALAEAVALAKREFGALHGVINAAMVLVNRVVRELSEAELRSALESKTDTTWSLLHAVRDEALDFVLFYSSGVAFEGNHGQAGYAAGCTFADAYALHSARSLPFPVRVLNLGYWHAGGDEDRQRVLRRVAAAGIRPLTAEQGMAVVERTLGAGLPQLLALDADQAILDNLGVAADRRLIALPGGAPPVVPEVRLGRTPVSDSELIEHQRAVAETEELAGRLLATVLHRAGVFAQPERRHDRADLAARLGVVPEHAALFQRQLDLLAAAGYLRAEDDWVQPTGRPVEPESEVVRAVGELIARRPGVEPVAGLLRDCLTALPDVLTGRRGAMEVLFPDGTPDRVAAVYRGDPVTDRCNAEVARLVVEQVEARLAAAPGTTVRVLEVGAGTGGTSAAVLAALARHGGPVEYVFTDVSQAFVRKARARFGADHPFARFEVLDIEVDPTDQGFAPGDCDIVLGTNVLHATRSLPKTLTQVKRLLRAGGVLLVTEGTRPLHQLALIFGLTPGWWLSGDPEHRIPGSPLASEQQWRDVLASCGYRDVSTGSPTTAVGPAFQSVIAAVSDGLVPLTRRDGAAVTAPVPEPPTGTAAPTAGAPAGHDDALEQVTAVFARVLEMTPEQLDPDLTFENYGVDSLVVLELTRGLEAVYGPLPATLLFERITMRQLADFFRAETARQPAARTAPEPEAVVPGEAERLVADLSDEAVDELLAQLLSQRGESEGGGR
jgi:polyketide synthase PksN